MPGWTVRRTTIDPINLEAGRIIMLPQWGTDLPAKLVVTIYFSAEAGPIMLNFASVKENPDDAIYDVLERILPIIGLPPEQVFIKKVFPYVRSSGNSG